MTQQSRRRDRKVFNDRRFRTHMPFCDGTDLVYCRAGEPVHRQIPCTGNIHARLGPRSPLAKHFAHLPSSKTATFRAWKIFHKAWPGGPASRLDTGFPDHAVECSPAFFREGSDLRVSFIAGTLGAFGFDYRLYEMIGPTFADLGPPVPIIKRPTSVGFVSPLHICYRSGPHLVLRDRISGNEQKLELPFARLLRASFQHDHPDRLLITGTVDERRVTVLHDLAAGQTFELRASGDLYKPTIFGDVVLHAEIETAEDASTESFRSAAPPAAANLAAANLAVAPAAAFAPRSSLATPADAVAQRENFQVVEDALELTATNCLVKLKGSP
jgi:hypothetical protein